VLCQSCEKGGGSGLNGFLSKGSTPSRKACCPLNNAILHKAHGVFDTENTELWEARHLVFDVALSRSKHRTVGGGLLAICRNRRQT